MDLLSLPDAAARLGVSVDVVERMIDDDTLLAIRFASGIRVLIVDTDRVSNDEPTRA